MSDDHSLSEHNRLTVVSSKKIEYLTFEMLYVGF